MDKSELPEDIIALIEKAQAGDVNSHYELGQKYRMGLGVEQNYKKAADWYIKAANMGHAPSQNVIGVLYRQGLGLEQNDNEAVNWYTKSANQGNLAAQYNLGSLYLDGIGVEQNDSLAFTWLMEAAKKGDHDAQCNIGWMYYMGKGIEPNIQEAVKWYEKAAAQGNDIAQINIGRCYWDGIGVEKDNEKALSMFEQVAKNIKSEVRFEAIELHDHIEREILSPSITSLRTSILNALRVDGKITSTMTHYTSLHVGDIILLGKSPLRLGHINAFNDPNEGKILWHELGLSQIDSNPVFAGCFLPNDDSLNMWRFYSKNNFKDDACGCAITFSTDEFLKFSLLEMQSENPNSLETKGDTRFTNTGKIPQESTTFYRMIYVDDNFQFINDEGGLLKELFHALKIAVSDFLKSDSSNKRLKDLSRLLGPLPYLMKDADYKSEEEHRILVTHLEYGANEIQSEEPDLQHVPPQKSPNLYLELYWAKHLSPIKHVTLGPKSPHQEMMIPYWHHKLASKYSEFLKTKPDFYIRASRCSYK